MINYKYNEKEYGAAIFKDGFQSNFLRYDLVILVKYVKYLGYTKKQTDDFMYEFCKEHIEEFNEVKYFKVIDKAIKDGRKRNNKLIELKKIEIMVGEIEYIDSLIIDSNYKKLLLAFLVKKKISLAINQINNPKAELSNYFAGSKKAYKEIFNMANLDKSCDIDMMVYDLVNKKIVSSIYKGDIALDFIKKIHFSKDVYVAINDFDNIGWVFDFYKGENKIRKCENFEECGKFIKQTNNKTKYCSECAKEVKSIQDKLADKKYKEKIKSEKIENTM